MKLSFYPRLAVSGMRKNGNIYFPYLLTSICMTAIFYIVSFLSFDTEVSQLSGGGTIQALLVLGMFVIGFFSMLFLFYSSRFLIRRRQKEFGLYNILGMNKRNIARILLWENLINAILAISLGLICGILFSKLCQIALMYMLGSNVSYIFSIQRTSIILTIVVFSIIFFLIFLYSLFQIHLTNPLALLHSDNVGEKQPRANYLLAVAGIIILAVAYWLAVSAKDPIAAIFIFFIAVIMVIAATYLLFISGSVAICKLLRRWKGYYYKTNHFVSVSSMVYRMKRNGAGLASICILSTMVLVIVSSTTCLFLGTEEAIQNRYPRDMSFNLESWAEADTNYTSIISEELLKSELNSENILDYRYFAAMGYLEGDIITFDQEKIDQADNAANYGDLRQLYFIPLSDYNRLTGQSETLSDGQALIYATPSIYNEATLSLDGLIGLEIQGRVDEFVPDTTGTNSIISSLYIIVPELSALSPLTSNELSTLEARFPPYHHYYGFDLDSTDLDEVTDLRTKIFSSLSPITENDSSASISYRSVVSDRDAFYSLNGGLFFLGILLGLSFVLATVLIMYYKQVTEGYEDQHRFSILQKVGMTKKEIKTSINSQVLTVFFLPLLMAGLHICFSFGIINSLLQLFGLSNTKLFITTSVISFGVFALFYVIVYLATSKIYFRIVSVD